ncbi:TetR/AcrR family transcriptional regulator [Amycolatopsis ultiminotia]|uniref:TetR/AcrR family transcriptional regulator n=1 Tax=Amycolatopsis ultiminotia TaxID=543629 RepID=A0ABP6XGC9_9PSEU
MARWEPDAYGRIRLAALKLFEEQGYDNTTVAQIAEQAGLNRRTFFHHFADKREVVFPDMHRMDELIGTEIRAQPESTGPLHAAAAGFAAAAEEIFEHQRAAAAQRSRIVAASPELREREVAKGSALADTVAAALRDRGVAERAAAVSAWSAVAVFQLAIARWAGADTRHPLARLIRETLDEFLDATAPDR